MADGEKPYRVYKGGRTKGKVPAPPRPERARRGGKRNGADGAAGTAQPDFRGPGARPRRRRRRLRIGRILLVCLILFVVWLVAWSVAGWLSVQNGMSDANKRLPRAVKSLLAPVKGDVSTTLLLGTDHARIAQRASDQHSDSIMLVRVDGKHHRIAYLSIPRDLEVNVPGLGTAKINAAYQSGGPQLALKAVRALSGLPVNHVVVVDFDAFRELVDALGGITVHLDKPIESNRFDCPYSTATRCREWAGWRFPKGNVHLDGRMTQILSRIRENRKDASENDLTRGTRQQQIMQAVTSKLTSLDTFLGLPFDGSKLVKPLATDLSTWQIVQLGWNKFRTGNGSVLHCRLGGDATTDANGFVIRPDDYNRFVIAMFTGASAYQPPPPSDNFYMGRCLKGGKAFG
jgi:LCP family protein required for cell wall assembly